MLTRKLVKAGPSSHTIALPKEWVQKNGLKKGDLIYIADLPDNKLALSNSAQAEQQKIPREKLIEIDGKSIDTIRREITSAYLNDYSLITLAGNSIPEKARQIRDAIHNFVALEITEQNTKRISAKDFLNLKEISIEKTIKRIDMMIRTMFDDLLSNNSSTQLQASLELRDEDINRLYFLLVRLLKSALTDSSIAKQLELQNNEILAYWQLVHDLESIADHIKQANEIVLKISKQMPKEASALYKNVQHNYLEAITAHYQRNKGIAETVAQQRQCLAKECSRLSSQNKMFTAVAETANAMTTQITNIARQVIDAD